MILVVTHAVLDKPGDQIDITAGTARAQTASTEQIRREPLQQRSHSRSAPVSGPAAATAPAPGR